MTMTEHKSEYRHEPLMQYCDLEFCELILKPTLPQRLRLLLGGRISFRITGQQVTLWPLRVISSADSKRDS
jgi:hypothetical protein